MRRIQWKELVAALGVVLSLLFVGYQIRQNTLVARGQTRQNLATLNQQWLILQSQDAEFHELWRRAWIASDTTLSSSDSARANFMMLLNLRRLENVYFQFSEGLVDESALRSYGLQPSAAILSVYRGPRFRAYWEKTRESFHPGFVRFFEENVGLRTATETRESRGDRG